METTKKVVLWLIHNRQGQIDGGQHFGEVFDSLDKAINYLDSQNNSLGVTRYDSPDDIKQVYGEDLPDHLKPNTDSDTKETWPIFEVGCELFEDEFSAWNYFADRSEIGSLEYLEDCDDDEICEIASEVCDEDGEYTIDGKRTKVAFDWDSKAPHRYNLLLTRTEIAPTEKMVEIAKYIIENS